MKKLLLLVSCCLFGICAEAQINLEHTFEGDYVVFNEKYFVLNLNSNTVNIYNSDYSLYKTVNTTFPSNLVRTIMFPSRHLFNSDEKFEFLIYASNYSANSGTCIICNEDGDIVKNITSTDYSFSTFGIVNDNGSYKLLVGKNVHLDYSYSYSYDLYSLPGIYEFTEEQNYVSNLNCYPNPAKNIVTLQYNIDKGMTSVINIYDINGRLIETKNVGSDFNEIHLDVTNYPSGIYIYECNGSTNRFIKQ